MILLLCNSFCCLFDTIMIWNLVFSFDAGSFFNCFSLLFFFFFFPSWVRIFGLTISVIYPKFYSCCRFRNTSLRLWTSNIKNMKTKNHKTENAIIPESINEKVIFSFIIHLLLNNFEKKPTSFTDFKTKIISHHISILLSKALICIGVFWSVPFCKRENYLEIMMLLYFY